MHSRLTVLHQEVVAIWNELLHVRHRGLLVVRLGETFISKRGGRYISRLFRLYVDYSSVICHYIT